MLKSSDQKKYLEWFCLNCILIGKSSKSYITGYSPQNTLGHQKHLIDKSPYDNYATPIRGPTSPRTQIRTILPPSATADNEILQTGCGEELFATEKSKEQLYIEAKHVLNMVEPYTTSTSSKKLELNGVSPPQTVPRKPPRSKHDPASNMTRPPSQEAANRVLIGTHMIGRQRSPEQTLNKAKEISNNSIEVSVK